jgi:hypothetical protein
MFKTAGFSTLFLTIAVFAGTSFGEAQPLEPTAQRPLLDGHTTWNNGWDFPRADVRENDPAKRKRLAGLLQMAHVHAAAQACGDIDIAHENIKRLFANDGFGPLSPSELAFVGGRISDFKDWLKAQAGEEVCEWAFENYGPKGAMHPDLVRSKPPSVKEPVTTSERPTARSRLLTIRRRRGWSGRCSEPSPSSTRL